MSDLDAPGSDIPIGLHQRGARLWPSLGQRLGTPTGELALEACRLADRLDELDRIVAGKGVLQLMRFRVGSDWYDDEGDRRVLVDVKFDSVLAETRQQQERFRAILNELGATKGGAKSRPAAAAPKRPANTRDQLRERRERREQKA